MKANELGAHYIILGGLVYCLNNEDYMYLLKAKTEYEVALRSCGDPMECYPEGMFYANTENWIQQNRKPISIRSDNFDLITVETETNSDDQDFPF